jgi:hypothetical protein
MHRSRVCLCERPRSITKGALVRPQENNEQSVPFRYGPARGLLFALRGTTPLGWILKNQSAGTAIALVIVSTFRWINTFAQA